MVSKKIFLTLAITVVTAILATAMSTRSSLSDASRRGGERGRASMMSNVPAQEGCTTAGLRGTYGILAQGTNVRALAPGLPAGPTAFVGLLTGDGAGNSSFTITQSYNGTIIQAGPFTGTYTVNADCTGSAVFATGGTFNIVVVDGGDRFLFMQTNSGTAVAGVAERIDQ